MTEEKRYRIDPFADARLGRSLFEMRPDDWIIVDDRPSKGIRNEKD